MNIGVFHPDKRESVIVSRDDSLLMHDGWEENMNGTPPGQYGCGALGGDILGFGIVGLRTESK